MKNLVTTALVPTSRDIETYYHCWRIVSYSFPQIYQYSSRTREYGKRQYEEQISCDIENQDSKVE